MVVVGCKDCFLGDDESCWFDGCIAGTDGRDDMKHICGTIAAKERGNQGKEGKVRCTFFSFVVLSSAYELLFRPSGQVGSTVCDRGI